MSVEIKIPAMLRTHVNGSRSIVASAGRLGDLLTELAQRYPGLTDQVLAEGGDLHRFVNVYVNDEDVRYLDKLDTKVGDGDVVAILPAVAGGSAPG